MKRIEAGSDLSKEEINLATLTAFLHQKCPNRRHANSEDVSELIKELLEAGYNSLASVEEDLKKASKAFKYYENKYPPGYQLPNKPYVSHKFADIGLVRISLSIINARFRSIRRETTKYIQRYEEALEKTK
jgi:hypothetical protein